MRLSEPRVSPLPDSEWGEESQELLSRLQSERRVLNIYRTLANHPKLLKRWSVFGTHVLFKNTLPPRERELLILRTEDAPACDSLGCARTYPHQRGPRE